MYVPRLALDPVCCPGTVSERCRLPELSLRELDVSEPPECAIPRPTAPRCELAAWLALMGIVSPSQRSSSGPGVMRGGAGRRKGLAGERKSGLFASVGGTGGERALTLSGGRGCDEAMDECCRSCMLGVVAACGRDVGMGLEAEAVIVMVEGEREVKAWCWMTRAEY